MNEQKTHTFSAPFIICLVPIITWLLFVIFGNALPLSLVIPQFLIFIILLVSEALVLWMLVILKSTWFKHLLRKLSKHQPKEENPKDYEQPQAHFQYRVSRQSQQAEQPLPAMRQDFFTPHQKS
jgi:hypothetical protein